VIAPLRDDTLESRWELIRLGQRYDRFGWVLGTGGNLSGRTERGLIVTASGRHKGMLTAEDFVELDMDGRIVAGTAGAVPSAEAAIHAAIYRAHPEAKIALHVHTPTAATTKATRAASPLAAEVGYLVFADLEMIKAWGFEGFGTEVQLPVFENHAAVETIADEIDAWFAAARQAHDGKLWAPALLIRSHGVTAWGSDAFIANRNLETAEFLMLARQRASVLANLG